VRAGSDLAAAFKLQRQKRPLRRWTRSNRGDWGKQDWKVSPITGSEQAVNQFAILFGERFTNALH